MHYIFLANGFEEIEMTAPLDILRRSGVDIKTVSITSDKVVVGSHGIKYIADLTIDELQNDLKENKIALVILPGGSPGVTNLDACELLHKYLDLAIESNALVCAICAAPMILGKRKNLVGKRVICYPGYEKYLEGAIIADEKCVKDGNFITAAAAGVSLEFGLAIVEKICGSQVSEKIKNGIRL